ncbi:hypothetical protein SALBM217S_04709 [Streptomyces griseoloalbus]
MGFREMNAKVVEATVAPGQRLFSQRGAMLAYRGEVSFTPNLRGGQGGVMSMIGRRVANEDTPLMTVEGSGTVLFGHGGHHVQVIHLSGTPCTSRRTGCWPSRARSNRARCSSARRAG